MHTNIVDNEYEVDNQTITPTTASAKKQKHRQEQEQQIQEFQEQLRQQQQKQKQQEEDQRQQYMEHWAPLRTKLECGELDTQVEAVQSLLEVVKSEDVVPAVCYYIVFVLLTSPYSRITTGTGRSFSRAQSSIP